MLYNRFLWFQEKLVLRTVMKSREFYPTSLIIWQHLQITIKQYMVMCECTVQLLVCLAKYGLMENDEIEWI